MGANSLMLSQWTYAEVQRFCADFKAVIKDRKNHYYHEVRCVYGRKPTSEEIAQMEASGAAGGETMDTS